MHIYLLDDDPKVLAANAFLLKAMGHDSRGWSEPARFLQEFDGDAEAVLLLDLAMPELDGLEVLAELDRRQCPVAVILLTGHGDVPQAVEAMKLGAVDFLEKPVDARRLAEVLTRAWQQAQALGQQADARRRVARLSAREHEVVTLVAQGLTNKAIAEQLCVAVRTVEVHRASAMTKLEAANMAELLHCWQLYQG
ncbi:response regulator transcription factor [Oceanimonas doudoroffii]|uniref:DNA-binding response regulator n=1 Tax=Oceanimonas doudoroffii TaxID=84158 RepID=A0A233RFT8_9GAMM|nr:response regulator [Oceanimonas doudoroffii]OXY82247.1 DNA-binding response regulator [Oceanimonas doudoroffii]